MTTTVLAYIPSPPRGVWYLGPVPIRAYALFIIVGIVVALVIGDRRWAARGGERGVIYDIALWAVPFGLAGGRLYHLATDWQLYFAEGGAGPIAALRIWDGGLGIWGAVALGGVGAWIGCRRRNIPLPAFGDAVAPGIVLAQAIGRLGNYFNQELYGRETTLPWGLKLYYRQDPSGLVDVHSLDGVSNGQVALVVQPTFLYELLWNLVVFAVLIIVDRRLIMGHGRLFALYVAGYCVGRFCIELLRDDAATHIAGIRINSFTSTFVLIGAVVYLILAPKGREDPATLGGKAAPKREAVPARELVGVAATSGAAQGAEVDEEADSPAATPAAEDEAVDVDTVDAADSAPETATAEEAEETEAEAVAQEPEEVEAEAVAEGAEGAAQEPEEVEPEEVEAEAVAEGAEGAAQEPEEVEAEEVAEEAEQAEAEEAAEEPEEVESEAVAAEPEEIEAEEAAAEAEEAELEAVAEEAEEAEPEEAETEKRVEEPAVAEADETEAEAEPEAEAEQPEIPVTEPEEPEAEQADEPEPEVTEQSVAAEGEPAEAGAAAQGQDQDQDQKPAPQVTEPTTATMPRWRSRLNRLTRRLGR
ncbi:prolipoprotein diacylglyceryl transferase [Mycobacterium shimoidei]|uniref:prolipoprotein diacylglyceryl transferase n=1 Tax=Mycobacterium shimoidei TaxID=29313 RepID=UPI000848808C|nr:prolipoprotein diacylglyceryl transferase [Mycobacterium shimoidei]MCV7260295.1 prolipoprotein diacylglyceryl transferase [Mycobacterium shimoidei]ODR12562.1 prolipoprotein diacylglyceryl transferase [Mycobacterium shimoidei]ORW82205.1 prolipoprotein diacylglyceryl transferase [Mycobacterium shimoidei]